VINGWRVFAHPLFLDQLEALIADVEALRRKDPKGYLISNKAPQTGAGALAAVCCRCRQ